MPRTFIHFLDGDSIYSFSQGQLISKAFRGKTGTAYLFGKVLNVKQGEEKEQSMTTGLHKIRYVYCRGCKNRSPIGWKYIYAYEGSQKYKEGKFILERHYLETENWVQEDEEEES